MQSSGARRLPGSFRFYHSRVRSRGSGSDFRVPDAAADESRVCHRATQEGRNHDHGDGHVSRDRLSPIADERGKRENSCDSRDGISLRSHLRVRVNIVAPNSRESANGIFGSVSREVGRCRGERRHHEKDERHSPQDIRREDK